MTTTDAFREVPTSSGLCRLTTYASIAVLEHIRAMKAASPEYQYSPWNEFPVVKQVQASVNPDVWDLIERTYKAIDNTWWGLERTPDECFRGACEQGLLDLAVYYVVHKGADVQMESNSPLKLAIANGRTEVVVWLIAVCGVDLTRSYGSCLEIALTGRLSHSQDAIQRWNLEREAIVSFLCSSIHHQGSLPPQILSWCWKHPYPTKQSNFALMKLLARSSVIAFHNQNNNNLTNDTLYHWFAELVLEGGEVEDEAARWLCEFYGWKIAAPAIFNAIAFQLPMKTGSQVADHKVSLKDRVKRITQRLKEHSEGAFMSEEERDLCYKELEFVRRDAALDEELAKKYSFARAASLLVDKWSISQRDMLRCVCVFGGRPVGKRGDVGLLRLMWSYYLEVRRRGEEGNKKERDHEGEVAVITREIRQWLLDAVDAAVGTKQMEFIREVSDLVITKDEDNIQLLSSRSRLKLIMAISKAQLSRVSYLIENDKFAEMDLALFDLILEKGDVNLAEWAVSVYLEKLASSSSLIAAERARNVACSMLGSWLQRHDSKYHPTTVIHSSSVSHSDNDEEEAMVDDEEKKVRRQRRRLCWEVVKRQDIIETLEEFILLRARPPFVDVSGDLDQWLLCKRDDKDWMLLAFHEACKWFHRGIPLDYRLRDSQQQEEEERVDNSDHDESDSADCLEDRISFR